MEKRIGDKEKSLTVEEIRAELSLCLERLSMKSTRNNNGEELEVQAPFGGQFKGKCRNCGQIGHESFQCKIPSYHYGGNHSNTYWRVSLVFLTQVLIEFSLMYLHRLAILNVRTVTRTTMF
jgi:hypothetical protein